MREKVIWVVNYDDLNDFVERALLVGASGVAIRTDNDVLSAITAFRDHGLKVFGWRWPSAKRDAAMKEADKVVNLLSEGLDGYFVDPEGEFGKPWNWNQDGLDSLAEDFCSKIRNAAPGKVFGTTSHYRAKATFESLPWGAFFKYSDIFLPQAYWRSADGIIGHGIPEDNYRTALMFWKSAGATPGKIVPIAGELSASTPDEINAHVQEAEKQGVTQFHFYAFEDTVDPDVWEAIKNV